MTTERLYYNDAYTLTFEATVLEVTTHADRPAVVLDRTYFYPEGGGQPADRGTLNGVRVLDVQTRPTDRAVLHVLEAPLNAPRVTGVIDGERRRDLRSHHSGQHILSQALERAAQAQTLSVHMSEASMTIDIDRADITPEAWQAVEQLANQVVLENRPVRAWFPSPEALAALNLRKLPEVDGKVRVVDIGGFDITACGGTHVAHTGEIGLIKIIKAERRGQTTRLEFKCGERALRDFQAKNDVINRLAAALTVGYWELPEAVARLQDQNRALQSDLRAAREQLAAYEAASLLAEAALHGPYRLVARAFARSADEVRLLAQALTAEAGVIALLGAVDEKAQLVFARSADVPLDVVPLLKCALERLGARGGGRPNMAQGGGVKADLAQVQAAIDAAIALLS
ncbi:MAG: alanyl-tRNA editing protein [Candidatus Thermofonsia Clade 1 bacterium]|uniref:Alanyl-tRNA editing protein n=1 Tax=Candidatus Thermofonsia Clade 1 bacterium TaxID=2364210 RepID=A0A2M8PCG7_9CHLR|nr:MAG: alanyl-tRNA editing protein [Candidatus Thermofonsia Clade 1 bacterium]RMF52884.1 MAG: alanyl-tRNA editing protein [Chloroflexota bacterium]